MMQAAAISKTSSGKETVVAVFCGPTQDTIQETASRWISCSGRLMPIPEKMSVDTASDLFDRGLLEVISKVQRELDDNRSVVVVYPTAERSHLAKRELREWFPQFNRTLHVRYTTVIASLVSLRVDTAILVDYVDFNPEALPHVSDLTRTMLNPRQISI